MDKIENDSMRLVQVGALLQEEQPPVDTAAYSAWKGWDATEQFGQLGRGDAAYFTRELREATRFSKPVKDVLEVGFGGGTFLAYCKSRGWDSKGTELSAEQVSAGRNAGFDVYPSTYLPELPGHSFDLVAAFDVLEHIPESEAVEFLTSLASKLRPSGALFLRFPNADSWLGNPLQHGDPTHVSAIGYYKIEYLAARAGLQVAVFRAPVRRGFGTSVIHGIHLLTAAVLVRTFAALQKALYFPGTRFVLSSSNVVCVLTRPDHGLPSAR